MARTVKQRLDDNGLSYEMKHLRNVVTMMQQIDGTDAALVASAVDEAGKVRLIVGFMPTIEATELAPRVRRMRGVSEAWVITAVE